MTTFTLLIPTREMDNSNHRTHWAVRARKQRELRAAARAACQGLPVLAGPVSLLITFWFPDSRHRDLDNLSLKGAIDGIVDAGLIADDRSTILRSVTRARNDGPAPRGYVRLDFNLKEVDP